jgi:hypothetical protein
MMRLVVTRKVTLGWRSRPSKRGEALHLFERKMRASEDHQVELLARRCLELASSSRQIGEVHFDDLFGRSTVKSGFERRRLRRHPDDVEESDASRRRRRRAQGLELIGGGTRFEVRENGDALESDLS